MGKIARDFLAYVKHQRIEWVKKPSYFNTRTLISDMINVYTNYKSTDKCDNQGSDNNKVLVALATDLKQEGAKNKKIPENPTSSATNTLATETGNSTGPPTWKVKKFRNTTTCPDTVAKYEWCKLRGRKN